ncbi:hypothetical protein [Actinokineospora sp.]|uniref:hypothetical protein n=1 Tax=Actinokineospora sp. TaxID=1872133 RepID=UPI003D6A4691
MGRQRLVHPPQAGALPGGGVVPPSRRGSPPQSAGRSRSGRALATQARIALGYALQHAPDAAVLVGFRDAEQITTTLTSVDDPLHPEEVVEITALLHPDTTDERTPARAVHRG